MNVSGEGAPPPPQPSAPLAGGGATQLHTLTVHGNKLSHTVSAALKSVCVANRQGAVVASDVASGLAEHAASVPALHAVEHQLKAERAKLAIALTKLQGTNEALIEPMHTYIYTPLMACCPMGGGCIPLMTCLP